MRLGTTNSLLRPEHCVHPTVRSYHVRTSQSLSVALTTLVKRQKLILMHKQQKQHNMLMILLIQERHLHHHLRRCWCNGARPDDKETSDNHHNQKSRSSFQRPPYEHDSRIRRVYPGVRHIQGRLIEAENHRETMTRHLYGPCSIPDWRWYKHQTYTNGPLPISRKDESWSNRIPWLGNTGI